MGFTDLDIKREYRSLLRDVVRDFYTPILTQSVLYRRAVGFFSSSALICLTDGLKGLLQNGGKVEVIASPKLSEEDLEAIRDGFERRDEIIVECLLREMRNPKGKFEAARLNLLSNLIASGTLTIKIALLETGNEMGMFHEKLGLMYDSEQNIVAFSGSMNESENAFRTNYESIDVFTSWSPDRDRVLDKQAAFNAMWNDYEPGIRVADFPEISEAIIEKYKVRDGIDLADLDVEPDSNGASIQNGGIIEYEGPHIPVGVTLRGYQEEAIAAWKDCGYRGIYDMATGTGKTYTALASIVALSNDLSQKLAVVIVCPYMHLVEQWKDDIIAFGLSPIVCHSGSKQTNWKERVKTKIDAFNLGIINSLCIVTTNASFATDFLKAEVSRLKGNCLIVVDEAHNFGARKLSETLPGHFPYRLALSATLERHGDDIGTERLYEYFGEKCIEYTLKDAINGRGEEPPCLTPYYYYPICVSLDEAELSEYLDLTMQIKKAVAQSEGQSIADLSDYAKMLLIKRARIVAAAKSKLDALAKAISAYKNDNHILVYCGATTVNDGGYKEGSPEGDEVRQIDAVVKRLQAIGIKSSKFTSEENSERRELLKQSFDAGRQLQALVAIRCLDEGVNIPSIKTAFILASSTNPKEYVQRRGRVLRKAPGKTHADIYDFITLPVPLEKIDAFSDEQKEMMKSLALREMARMVDFADIAENPSESDALMFEIANKFGISLKDEWGESYV